MKTLIFSACAFFLIGSVAANDYTGTPYPDGIPHAIPGTIEAEDFDNGGEGVAYHDELGRQNGSQVYRETDVDIQSHGSGRYNIGHTAGGEWTKYTINAAQAGSYKVEVYCVSGSNSGRFHLEIDDVPVCRVVSTPNGDWNDFSKATLIENVQITEGTHILTWYTYGGMNIDKFVFTRTGEWTGEVVVGNFNYPITKKMSNPLFVDFDSPMFEGNAVGALYTADPSAHVWEDGRLYVYASHDIEPAVGCDRMDRYHVFSTDDMENWTDHGEILNSSQVSWGRPEGGFMWAPDCAYNPENQTYYFYFPHPSGTEWDKTWKIGVATSKKPAEDFVVQGYIEGLEPLIDPCVFVDDDGQPYIYHGGAGRCMAGKLDKNDWTKLDGTTQVMKGLVDFHEATWVHKYNGKYYLSHSDGHGDDGNQMRYAISDNPFGPWQDMGVYMYGTGTETNHGSIVEYKGKWYSFYHTSNYSGNGALRSVCVDELEYNEDGTIKVVQNYGTPFKGEIRTVIATEDLSEVALTLEAEDFNEGGEHYAYHEKDAENLGNNKTYRPGEGVDLYTQGNVTYVGNIIKGEWIRYTITVEKTGLYDIDCILSSNQGGSRFHLSINGADLSGDLTPAGTTSNWRTVTGKNILLKAGEQYLDLRAEEGNFNVDKFVFRKAQPYQGTVYTKGNHNVPGTIEAEDYDIGGEGIAYHEVPWGNDSAEKNSGGHYRTGANEGVDIEYNSSKRRYNISHTNGGEWIKYTLHVEQTGIYDVTTVVVGNASYSLTFDDIDEHPTVSVNTGSGWEDYQNMVTSDVYLTAGTHVMRFSLMGGGINIDKFIFELKTPIMSVEKLGDSKSSVYPNPNNGVFYLDLPESGKVTITDINGKIVYQETQQGFAAKIDISDCVAGIYIATIQTGENTQTIKLIKQ